MADLRRGQCVVEAEWGCARVLEVLDHARRCPAHDARPAGHVCWVVTEQWESVELFCAEGCEVYGPRLFLLVPCPAAQDEPVRTSVSPPVMAWRRLQAWWRAVRSRWSRPRTEPVPVLCRPGRPAGTIHQRDCGQGWTRAGFRGNRGG